MTIDPRTLLFHAQNALGMNQTAIAEALGYSRRSATRYAGSGLPGHHYARLAALAYPRNRAFAAEVAAMLGKTLAQLGLEAPPAPAPRQPPAAPTPVVEALVDAIVCAAADAMHALPEHVRPGLLAAVTRARAVDVGLEVLERTLREKLAPAKGAKRKDASSS